jgi:oxygen-independent coproporphyrinogen-3 oxidase
MNAAGALGVYVHLPFCPYICPYCDFAKRPWKRSEAATYLEALLAEMARSPARRATTLFFGGGTPNAYPASVIATLIERVRSQFGLPLDAEVTLEANPDPRLCEEFPALREAGVNRVSFGVQSLDANELETLGRRHTARDVGAAVAAARAAGLTNISLDLMFGTPGQTLDSWQRTLLGALALEPDHISAYGLTVEEETPFWRWHEAQPQAFPSSDDEADLYAMAIATLCASGFEHYEISNFARPGRRCSHNENYWRNGPYAGFGVGASSYLDGVRRANTRDYGAYVQAALAGGPIPAEEERLDPRARAGEAAMLALRTADGVNLPDFRERYDVEFLEYFAPVIREMRAAGLLEADEHRVFLTPRGRFVANDVCGAFVTYAP